MRATILPYASILAHRHVLWPEVFLIFTTQLYQYLCVIFLFAPVSDEPEVFLPKYSKTAILLTSGG